MTHHPRRVKDIGMSRPDRACLHCQDAFQQMNNTYGAVWEADTLPGLPLDVRITDSAGDAVVVPCVPFASFLLLPHHLICLDLI